MLTIVLPWPSSQLSPNARTHWAKKAQVKAFERAQAKVIARAELGSRFMDACSKYVLDVTFNVPDKRHRDLDNMLASCKAQLDGVADALGVDDTRFEPVTLHRGSVVKGGQVVVRIGD